MDAFVKLVAAGPLFFVSAWLLMIFAGIVGADVGIEPFGYVTSMVVTIALWLTLAPAIGAAGRTRGKKTKKCHPVHGHNANSANRPTGYRMITRKTSLRVGRLATRAKDRPPPMPGQACAVPGR
jgi:hypothetical protein